MSAKEGARLMKEGQKALKGGWFSSPDPETAARRFDAACKEYRQAGAQARPQYLQALQAAAGAYAKIDSYHSAAKHLETAAALLDEEEKRPAEAAELYQQAALHHRANGHPDKAASDLIKGGKAVAAEDLPLAEEYFDQALSVFEEEERARFSNDAVKAVVAHLLSLGHVEAALKVMRRQNALYLAAIDTFERYLYKNMLGVVVALFHLKRYEEARSELVAFRQQANFTVSPECEAAEALVEAYLAADREALAAARKRPQLQHLDNRVARLAARLEFDDSVQAQAAAAADQAAAAEVDNAEEFDFK